jgi:hypothetical protein
MNARRQVARDRRQSGMARERMRGERGCWLDSDTRAVIRERVDLAELVAEHVDLRRAGAGRHVGRCPFHAEKSPSFTIYEDRHFHCFGCSAHGDAFDFVMRARGISFSAAAAELAHRAGVPFTPGHRVQPLGPTPRQHAITERERVFDELRALLALRAQISLDAAGSPTLETFMLENELPDVANRELVLVARFFELTMAAHGERRMPRAAERAAA